MRRARVQLQILRRVVRGVAVTVMNDFRREQRSSEHALHHDAVVPDGSSALSDHQVAVGPETALSIAATFSDGRIAAELLPSLVVTFAPSATGAGHVCEAGALRN
jgi:hypothetical protein